MDLFDTSKHTLHPRNTYKGSELAKFNIEAVEFRFGFWPMEVKGVEHPFPALICMYGSRWALVHKTYAIIDGNLHMEGMVGWKAQLDQYMFYIEHEYTPKIVEKLKELGIKVDSLEMWERVMKLMGEAVFEDGKLKVGRLNE